MSKEDYELDYSVLNSNIEYLVKNHCESHEIPTYRFETEYLKVHESYLNRKKKQNKCVRIDILFKLFKLFNINNLEEFMTKIIE